MSGFSFGSAIGSNSVRQSRGGVNEILIVQIARVKREFHALRGEILRGSVLRGKSPGNFIGISAEIAFGIGSAKDFPELGLTARAKSVDFTDCHPNKTK
jgi:hypothetical protein